MQKINTIIWDLGGVLIDWDPRYVFTDIYFSSPEESKYFLEHICTPAWNERQDEGYPIALATEEKIAEFPGWEKAIRDYYGRWTEMLGGPIQDTVELFRQVKENPDTRSYALTNWSAETFPIALQRYDFLNWFHGRLVSGEEKTRKPFPEFFALLVKRFPVNKEESLFIDDNLRNVKAANEFGFNSIHFKNPLQLEGVLKEYALI
jgi:2-haloacid dehalogenase